MIGSELLKLIFFFFFFCEDLLWVYHCIRWCNSNEWLGFKILFLMVSLVFDL